MTDAIEDHHGTVSIEGQTITNLKFADDIDGFAGGKEKLTSLVNRWPGYIALGQAIAQAVRQKILLAPLQLGTGVELHHLFASRYLIKHLNKLGFSCSYKEVRRFEQNAALTQGVQLNDITGESCVQFVADNVDRITTPEHSMEHVHSTGWV